MTFEFATATRIIFGTGALAQLESLGCRVWRTRFCGDWQKSSTSAEPAISLLQAAGLTVETFAIASEPTINVIKAGVVQAKSMDCTVVVSFGGGSVIDTGKAIAALTTNPGEPLDYLEGDRGGKIVDGNSKTIHRDSNYSGNWRRSDAQRGFGIAGASGEGEFA